MLLRNNMFKHLTMLRTKSLFLLILLSSLLEKNACNALRGRISMPTVNVPESEQKVTTTQNHHYCPASSEDAVGLLAGFQGKLGDIWVTNKNGITCVNIAKTIAKLRSVNIHYKCTPPASNNPRLFNHHPDPLHSAWCFSTLRCDGEAPNGYLSFHAEVKSTTGLSVHRRDQTVTDGTITVDVEDVTQDGGGDPLFDPFDNGDTTEPPPDEFPTDITPPPLVISSESGNVIQFEEVSLEEKPEPVFSEPVFLVDPVFEDVPVVAAPETNTQTITDVVTVQQETVDEPQIITVTEDPEDIIFLNSEANQEPLDVGTDPTGTLHICDPHAIANQAILEQAIENVEADTMLGVHWRRSEEGRLDSFFTISGLFNMTAYRAWCLDADAPMCIDCVYPFDVCTTYRDDFSELTQPGGLANVSNFPQVNWLINTYPVNTSLSANDTLCPIDLPHTTKVTWRIFQSAIWKLIDQDYHHIIRCIDNECEQASDALVACAMEHGQTYMPVCCNETIGLILAWDDPMTGELSRQELLVEVPLGDIPGVCPEPEPPLPTEPPNYPTPHPTDPCLEECINVSAVEAALIPFGDEVLIGIKFRSLPNTRNDSFFTVDGLLNNTNYAAWCIDVDQYACIDCEWTMDAYSTYDDDGLTEFREAQNESNVPKNFSNFNEVNYLINNFDVDTPLVDTEDCTFDVPNGTIVTWNMMQRALWVMVDYEFDPYIDCPDGTVCGDGADQLMECAFAQGADYVPKCCPNNKVAVLIVWDDDDDAPTRQEILVEVPVYHIPEACPPEFGFPPLQRRLTSETPYISAAWAKFQDPLSWGGFYCENNS